MGIFSLMGAEFLIDKVKHDLGKDGTVYPSPKPTEAKGNEWKCPNCGNVNSNYVGTCGCGTLKPKRK